MKTLITSLLICVLFISCSDDDDTRTVDVLSVWKLTATLQDPGDGSGVFQPTTIDKSVTFYSNFTVSSNGNLCGMSENIGNPTNGTFSSGNGIISPINCTASSQGNDIQYVVTGTEMILTYVCIEPCREKYIKIE